MKKKAYIVGISPSVRVVVPENATEEQIIDIAIEKMRKDPDEYLHATHCNEVKEDTECPYNPETDETPEQGTSKVDALVEAYLGLTCAEKDEFLRLTDQP